MTSSRVLHLGHHFASGNVVVAQLGQMRGCSITSAPQYIQNSAPTCNGWWHNPHVPSVGGIIPKLASSSAIFRISCPGSSRLLEQNACPPCTHTPHPYRL